MIRRFGLFALALLLWTAAVGRDAFDDWIDATTLPPVLAETSVDIRGANGSLLRAFPVEGGRMRLKLPLTQTDPEFISMLIAYEDKRFYQHAGVDPLALIRAGWQAMWSGEIVSGGSTLTMQVARLLENSGTGRMRGKLRQMRVAMALERRLNKAQILELYLQHAPYGGALEGLRAGSIAWFGKEPLRLDPEEAALLIALPQSPETRRPDRHPNNALKARNRVLVRLGANPSHKNVPRRMRSFPRLAPHLTDRLHREDRAKPRHDLTIQPDLQRAIEALAARAVSGQPNSVSAAILVADHQTGKVLAHVGSAGYSAKGEGFVDMTTALRSPGSTLKPLVYALAFDQGLAHPDTLIDDAPVDFNGYAPQNFDGFFRGELTVRDALTASLNIPPVMLTHEMGAGRLVASMRKAGAKPIVPGGKPGLAVALGGVGLTLQDLTTLYAGLAQGGRARPLTIRAGEQRELGTRIVSRAAAWQVAHILADIPPPAGMAARQGEIAYKTGTSYGHRDAWAVGFDGQHVVAVWLGRPDGTPVPGVFGGDIAAPILFEAFGHIAPQRTELPQPPPETLIVTTASLPQPLQRFRPRGAAFNRAPNRPVVLFPPDGATLLNDGFGVPLKLRAGVLPLTVLVDGKPAVTGLTSRETLLNLTGPGFSRIAVIDAVGNATRVEIRLD